MSAENVGVARRVYDVLGSEGMNERAVATLVEAGVLADGAELDLRTAYPDGEVWSLEEAASYFDAQPWGRSMRFEAESFTVVDEDRVLAFVRTHAVGGGSGIEVEGRYAHLLTFREHRLARAEVYTDRDDALASVGLAE